MKKLIPILAVLAVVIGGVVYYSTRPKKPAWQEVKVEKEAFSVTVPASGTVSPENKVSIISPIAGRIDKILVQEGEAVKRSQVLSWMSSTDRAALLDSAQAQGSKSLGEWADVYKPTPILSPAPGVIIASNIVVGQTVGATTTLFELSDRLVVIADVDETDLGKVRMGQVAKVTVDSFPGLVVETKVARIAHQSKNKNSINTYEVLLLPTNLPDEFRSGLTASVQFLYSEKAEALVVPTWIAEGRENFTTKVLVKNEKGEGTEKEVRFGLSNGQKIEVEGLNAGDTLLVKNQNILTEKSNSSLSIGGPPGGGGGRGGRR